MSSAKSIKNELDNISFLQSIVLSLQDISAVHMKKTKEAVLKTRQYLFGLNDIYKSLPTSSLRIDVPIKDKLIVFLSPNSALYGDIISKVFYNFVDEIDSVSDVDILIVGKLGKYLYDNCTKRLPYDFIEFDPSITPTDRINRLLGIVYNYKNSVVFFPQFVDVSVQKVGKVYLNLDVPTTPTSTNTPSNSDIGPSNVHNIDYIYEPSFKDVCDYFSLEIKSAILSQVFFEASLGKHASRIVSLNIASSNIDKYIKVNKMLLSKQLHKKLNTPEEFVYRYLGSAH